MLKINSEFFTWPLILETCKISKLSWFNTKRSTLMFYPKMSPKMTSQLNFTCNWSMSWYVIINYFIKLLLNFAKFCKPYSLKRRITVQRDTLNIAAIFVQVNPRPHKYSKNSSGMTQGGLPRPPVLEMKTGKAEGYVDCNLSWYLQGLSWSLRKTDCKSSNKRLSWSSTNKFKCIKMCPLTSRLSFSFACVSPTISSVLVNTSKRNS
jgi:hypothetical protein